MLSDFLLLDILGQFTDPKKRLFFGYVISALFIAFFWLLFIKKQTARQSFREAIAPHIWISKSSRIDFVCFVINRTLFFFIQPALVTQIAIATVLFHWLHTQSLLPMSLFENAPYWLAASLFTVFFFLLDDFARFITHLAFHKIPALWEFHKFHHSAEHLTLLTVTRTHPVEGIIFAIRSAIVQGVSIALFVFLFGNEIGLVTIYGVNMFVVIFHGLGSNLRHSHIAIRYPRAVEVFFMSPAQHQLHHSDNPQHFDKNFGVALSLWDWACGSFLHSTDAQLRFGIGEKAEPGTAYIWRMYFEPFAKLNSRMKTIFPARMPLKIILAHFKPSNASTTPEDKIHG